MTKRTMAFAGLAVAAAIAACGADTTSPSAAPELAADAGPESGPETSAPAAGICTSTTCNGHGACAVSGPSTTCTCDAGYAGANCEMCATGFQDNDGDDTCTAACSASTCASHGTCSDTGGTATCTCSKGWRAPGCASCAPNFAGANCDTCAPEKGGADCDWDQVYGLDMPAKANWDTYAEVPYDVDESAAAGSFTRVAYRMVLGTETVWVEMDAFTTDKKQLGIPTDWIFDQTVANVRVVSTAANTPSVAGPVTGILEFWSNCYAPQGGDSNVHDYDDTASGSPTDCYGSFQVHIGTNTVFAYNRWSETGSNDSDLGFGNRATAHPDWTFASNAATYATRRLDVFVK